MNITLPEELYQYLRKWAFEQEVPMSKIIQYLVTRAGYQMLESQDFQQEAYNMAMEEQTTTKEVETNT